MIMDAVVPVVCDHCFDEIQIEPPYVYSTYTGVGGRYDTSDPTLIKLLEAEGWIFDDDSEQVYCCEECQKEAEA